MFWCISFSWKSLAKMTWICKYVWAALKHHLWKHLLFSEIWFDDDDKSNGNSCYCSGNYSGNYFFFYIPFFYCFLFLCLPAAYYFTYIFLFILLLSLHWNFWWCLRELIYPQVHSHTTHDFFLYCLGFPPVFLRCDVNEIKLHQWTCATKEKAEPLISLMPRYIFSFIMSFSSHIFIYSFLYYFSAPHFTNLASLHSVAIVVVYLI